ncbi:hypothetical protein [Dethiosulfatarculus sandiegensis]|uniref:DUF1850 domain-containing protein n=1 Tax=Dethiosulfatarculus sandiegensis TaxID=1429043 RepID=A0A0D2HVM1_9BACT|nr:hypothetical protein [Dethiosulfatarculus sandiegensis]KIX14433.1 hypothetical protein X474_09905 [Dethiosulfatarculus sandiegensis]
MNHSALFWKGLILLCILFLSPWHLLPAPAGASERALFVNNPQTGLEVLLPLAGVDEVSIRFFHSYDYQWVKETFAIEKGRFVPKKVAYRDDSYDWRDQRYDCSPKIGSKKITLGQIKPRKKDRLVKIITRVAHIKSQQLILKGANKTQTIPFTQWGRPGQRLIFSIKGD